MPVDGKTGMTSKDQLDSIFKELKPLYKMRDRIYESLENEFRDKKIGNLKYEELNVEEKNWAINYYKNEIKPLLSPNVVYKMHPFPFMENNQLYIVAELDDKGRTCYLLLPINKNIPAFKKLWKKLFG